jgi:hypothetical protein
MPLLAAVDFAALAGTHDPWHGMRRFARHGDVWERNASRTAANRSRQKAAQKWNPGDASEALSSPVNVAVKQSILVDDVRLRESAGTFKTAALSIGRVLRSLSFIFRILHPGMRVVAPGVFELAIRLFSPSGALRAARCRTQRIFEQVHLNENSVNGVVASFADRPIPSS